MKIEFVSYDGKYPNLCCGKLTLRIGGVKKTFGYNDCDYLPFWESGGGYDVEFWETHKGKWELCDYIPMPAELIPYAEQLIDVFNANVEWGCCGGCI